MKQLATIGTLVLLVMATVAFGQKKITRSFTGVDKIDLNTASGDCILMKSDDKTVELTLEYTYDDDDYEPVIEQNGSRLILKETFNGRSANGKASWVLKVPENMDIRFNTGSGDLRANNLNLEIDMNTGSGDLHLQKMKGEITANTGSGKVDLDDFEGELSVNTGSGDIEVGNSSGDLRVNCGSGSINMDDVSGSVMANIGSGDIKAQNIKVLYASSFNSGSGDVDVVLASSPVANLSVNSGSGDAELDFNGNKLVGTLTMQADKNRGKISAPITFDKEEEIKEGKQTYIKKTANLGGSDVKIKIGTGSGTASLKK